MSVQDIQGTPRVCKRQMVRKTVGRVRADMSLKSVPEAQNVYVDVMHQRREDVYGISVRPIKSYATKQNRK